MWGEGESKSVFLDVSSCPNIESTHFGILRVRGQRSWPDECERGSWGGGCFVIALLGSESGSYAG